MRPFSAPHGEGPHDMAHWAVRGPVRSREAAAIPDLGGYDPGARAPGCDHQEAAAQLFSGDGRSEVEPLHFGAPLAAHQIELLLGLDALGRHREAERSPEAADGPDDCEISSRLRYIHEEAPVDLDFIERKS